MVALSEPEAGEDRKTLAAYAGELRFACRNAYVVRRLPWCADVAGTRLVALALNEEDPHVGHCF
jgi:hypothetical protein